MAIADNKVSRDAVLGRVRKALKVDGNREAARAAAEAYVAAHAHGPRPAMPTDLLARFMHVQLWLLQDFWPGLSGIF